MIKILIVEDDPLLWHPLQFALEGEGYNVQVAMDGADALALSIEESFDLLLQDLQLPDSNGLDIMREILLRHPTCMALVMTGHATIENAVEAMKIGAFDFITKPFHPELVLLKIRRVIEFRNMSNLMESSECRKKSMMTRCTDMKKVIEMAEVAAPTEAAILLLGESGTGKEVLANHIQSLSSVKDKPYIKVNCAAIPDSLFESEIFGSDKGAYTGSVKAHIGYVESAHGGTLLLDEITDLPLGIQGKLLRVLEDGSFYRVGGTHPLKSKFRLIATSRRDLSEAVHSGEFREDLYYRINVISLIIPPLRQRREDIPLLTAHFLKLFHTASDGAALRLSSQVLDILSLYDYPGNVRELRNILEHLSLLYHGEKIKPVHLPVRMRDSAYIGSLFETFTVEKPLRDATLEFETRYIEKMLKATGGNKTRASALLGISRKALWERLNHIVFANEDKY
ncbi:MAG: sigma-54 dependent transcriptional regulator [Desulfuromonadaceae bacterium]|nr:sigma-54 dependent transcriptional regulator [Desulfuromonadaceae bacterium]MDD5104438.1 sigma-54 dependent transcriptional regulator [Desulfuromonadaceae bacterium]